MEVRLAVRLLLSAHRAVMFAIAQLSCLSIFRSMIASCEQFQVLEDDSTTDAYLVSEEVQFANLESSFREVN